MGPAKMAETIEICFGDLTHVGPMNHVFDGVEIRPREGAILGVVRPIDKHCESVNEVYNETSCYHRRTTAESQSVTT